MNAVSIRGDWVGQVIDGRYPLLEWLGGSGTSGTFLTELDGLGSQRAAIKLSPATSPSEDRLAGWPAAARLSHPHLAHIHHYGRADVEGGTIVYIVTDLAEELLSQIIPERALNSDEARQMLSPVLDALEYLQGAGFVHGHLKPSNILVVENEIKLSSDGLIATGKSAPELLINDIHVAPEVVREPISPRADIWSLGITLVEALTQEPPIWDSATDAHPDLPGNIRQPFAEIAKRCLHPDPSRRCTLAEVRTLLAGKSDPRAARPAAAKVAQPVMQPAPPEQRPDDDKPLPARMPFLPLVIGLVLLVIIILGLRLHSRKTQPPAQTETTRQAAPAEPGANTEQPKPVPVPPSSIPPSSAAPVASPPTPASTGDVISRDVPDVPQRARNTIHGTVAVVVRVNVDPSGAVSNADFATHGPSAYFARIALDSARKWKFKSPQQDGNPASGTWLLHYHFRRNGVEVAANQASH